MPRLKITSRAKFYSGDSWINWASGNAVYTSDEIIVRNIDEYQISQIVDCMNHNHDHPEGEFYCSPANSNDHDYVDYYIIYRNPIAP
jgi:hypothetical protein